MSSLIYEFAKLFTAAICSGVICYCVGWTRGVIDTTDERRKGRQQ